MRTLFWLMFLLMMGCPGFGSQTAGNGILLEVPDAPNYEDHIKLVMEFHCVSCHGENPTPGSPTNLRLDIYSGTDPGGVFEFKDRVLIRSENTDFPMPPTPPFLDAIELETIERWIEQGAPESSDTGDTP